MNASDWRQIELHHASDGSATTVGAEILDAVIAAAAGGNDDEAVTDAIELALTVNEIGRPHDALAIIEAFREQAGQISSPNLAWLDNAEGIAASHTGHAAFPWPPTHGCGRPASDGARRRP